MHAYYKMVIPSTVNLAPIAPTITHIGTSTSLDGSGEVGGSGWR